MSGNSHHYKMEYDSIMDISMNFNTIDDVSTVNEVSMEVSTPTTPVPESWTTPVKVETKDPTEILQKVSASMPDFKAVLERQKKALTMVNEKNKMLEAKLANAEMKLQEMKVALSNKVSEVQSAKEETKNLMSELSTVQNRIKSTTKEIEDMKTHSSLANKENSNAKDKLDLYRQLTGIIFAVSNPNSPHELKGFAASAGPISNLKTFSFNTAEHSNSLMNSVIWNVAENMHKKNWENISED